MSLLTDSPATAGRAEARTASGWQRFDRAAANGAFGLLLGWLLVWLIAAFVADDEPAGEPVLARAEAPVPSGDPRTVAADADRPSAAPGAAGSGAGGRSPPAGAANPPAAGSGMSTEPRTDVGVKTPSAGAARPTTDASQSRPASAGKGASLPFAERMPDAGPGATPRPLSVAGASGAGRSVASAGGAADGAPSETAAAAARTSAIGSGSAPGPTGSPAPGPGALSAPARKPPATAGEPTEPVASVVERIPTRSAGPISAPAPDAAGASRDANLALLEPILDLRAADGRLQIDGILGSEDTRRGLVRAALKVYGMRNLTDRLAVSPGVASLPWAERVDDLMVLLDGPDTDIRVRVSGQMVTL
ncbi:MAG: hypothetical protein R3E87_19635, partial [Burkholderiaceae bacterium]